MIRCEDLYVILEFAGDTEIWKDSVFAEQEADIEVEIAKKETGKRYKKYDLDDYFVDLSCSYY